MFMSLLILAICLVSVTFIPVEDFLPYELIVLALLALGNGMLRPTAMAILSRLTDRTKQGLIMGVFASLSSLSMGIGAFVTSFLYVWYWKAPFIVGASILMIPILLIFVLQGVLLKLPAKPKPLSTVDVQDPATPKDGGGG